MTSQQTAAQSGPGPLAGIRVIEVSTMMAGPYSATLLGDLGADVIKVESHYGDDSRHLGPGIDGERSAFLSLNRSKRGVVLDLRTGEAQDIFSRLVATADILITNVREPALTRLGLGYEQVRRGREDIIWIGITAFGDTGPYAGRPGIDFLIQGYAGLLALNGEPDGATTRVTVPLIDSLTSVLACTGALAAVHSRSLTGEGQRIDISLLDALVHAQASGLGSYLVTGEEPARVGNRSLYFAPSGVYPTSDGKEVVITCPSQKFFENLCAALEVDLVQDPRFATIEDRLANNDALDDALGARCRCFGADELMARLIAADVLTAPVNSAAEVAEDPQILHNEMIVSVEHRRLGPISVTGVPVKLAGTPGRVSLPPPVKGQHTREILEELGYTADQIAELAGSGAVAVDTD